VTRNRELETKLLMAGSWNRDTMPTNQRVRKGMVIVDSLLRIVGAEHADINVECFPGFKTEQLNRMIGKRDVE
jgi:hypothetical protein